MYLSSFANMIDIFSAQPAVTIMLDGDQAAKVPGETAQRQKNPRLENPEEPTAPKFVKVPADKKVQEGLFLHLNYKQKIHTKLMLKLD